MNIGVDIDGVLTNYERFAIDFGTKYCIEEGIEIQLNKEEYYEKGKFNWTEEQEEKFWNKYLETYVNEFSPRKFASEVIEKLQKEGHKIYLITARNETGLPVRSHGKMQEMTKEWLKKNNIKYEKIIFVKDQGKLSECKENKIDVMIEDSPNNIKDISKEIPVIKCEWFYNKDVEGDNIRSANSWYQIYEIISKMK